MLAGARSVAVPERHQDAERRLRPGVKVGYWHGAANRWPIGITGHEQIPAGGERRQIRGPHVGTRTGLPVRRDRTYDQSSMVLAQGFVAEPQVCQLAGAECLDQDIGPGEQRAQALSSW
jgi:hypothetical protein